MNGKKIRFTKEWVLKNIPFYISAFFSACFLCSYFLPFAYTYSKGNYVSLSGFDCFSFSAAGGYRGRQAKRRRVSYAAGGLILFVTALALLSKEEIQKRALILVSILFLVLIGGEIGWIIERNAYADSNVYPHVYSLVQLILSVLFFAAYIFFTIFEIEKDKKKAR